MDELIDDKLTMKERRGKTLPVLAVLSFIWIAYNVVTISAQLVKGPLSDEEIDQQKYELLQTYDEDSPSMVKEIMEESMETLDILKENFWALASSNIIIYALGFIAVFMMLKLKKAGFYMYILYCVAPIAITMMYFSGFKIMMVGVAIQGFFSILFLILYGVQLKRMS